MPTTAELIRKEDETLNKARTLHRARLKKLEENELKRFFKILKQIDYFEHDFTDDELFDGLQNMIKRKAGTAGQSVNHDTERE